MCKSSLTSSSRKREEESPQCGLIPDHILLLTQSPRTQIAAPTTTFSRRACWVPRVWLRALYASLVWLSVPLSLRVTLQMKKLRLREVLSFSSSYSQGPANLLFGRRDPRGATWNSPVRQALCRIPTLHLGFEFRQSRAHTPNPLPHCFIVCITGGRRWLLHRPPFSPPFLLSQFLPEPFCLTPNSSQDLQGPLRVQTSQPGLGTALPCLEWVPL